MSRLIPNVAIPNATIPNIGILNVVIPNEIVGGDDGGIDQKKTNPYYLPLSGGLAHRETGRFPGGPLLQKFFRAPCRTCEFI